MSGDIATALLAVTTTMRTEETILVVITWIITLTLRGGVVITWIITLTLRGGETITPINTMTTTVIAIPGEISNNQKKYSYNQNYNENQSHNHNNGYNGGNNRSANCNSGQGGRSSNQHNDFRMVAADLREEIIIS